mmetsp:Transcript_1713/g.6342  ORF Transcript_1713/g.6342 Transcript_1713/m.6342 type:complete len:200 (-) Transcript_1713:414-1013(-)
MNLLHPLRRAKPDPEALQGFGGEDVPRRGLHGPPLQQVRKHPRDSLAVLGKPRVELLVLRPDALEQVRVHPVGGAPGIDWRQAPKHEGLSQRRREEGQVGQGTEPAKALADRGPLGLAEALPDALGVPNDVVRPVEREVRGLLSGSAKRPERGGGQRSGKPSASLVQQEHAEGLGCLVHPPARVKRTGTLEPGTALEIQ